LKHFGINSIDELPKPREINEILKDDDMAEHRQFLFDRQLELKELQETAEDEDATETAMSLIEAVEKIDEDEVPDLEEYTADVLQLDKKEEDDETKKELENESDNIQENLENESTKKEEE